MWLENCLSTPSSTDCYKGKTVHARFEANNQVVSALWLDAAGVPESSMLDNLRAAGLQPMTAPSAGEIRLISSRTRLVVVRLEDSISPLREVITAMRTLGTRLPIICRVDTDRMTLGIKAMQEGAGHVMASDNWSVSAWREAVALLIPVQSEQRAPFVFEDPASRELLDLARRVSKAGVTTLLTGPTGAGKEVLARVLHESSARSNGPFVGLNCAALPESMIEDILFGHEKGAFTGATRELAGVFEQANGGTLFLDEIAEIPFPLQSKLLRVLQERQVTRLGAQSAIQIDVRLVAATNCDLRSAMLARTFREDLYFRISTFRLRVPALAERPGDIMPLARHLLELYAQPTQTLEITPEAEAALMAYSWPGNVRELANVMQRALVLCDGGVIDAMHLLFEESFQVPMSDAALQSAPIISEVVVDTSAIDADAVEEIEVPAGLGAMVRDSEYRAITAALRCSSNRIQAAQALGISPRTLRYKLARFKDQGLSLAHDRG